MSKSTILVALLWAVFASNVFSQSESTVSSNFAADRAAALIAAKGGPAEIERFIASRVARYRDRFDVSLESSGHMSPARIVAESSFHVESKELDLELERGVEYIAHSARGVGRFSATGKIVFVGYGIDAPEIGWNDFKDVDLSGKVCFVLPGIPLGATPLDRLAATENVRPSAKVGRLTARGAAAVVFVHRPFDAANAAAEWTEIVCAHARRRVGLPDTSAPAVEAFMPWDVARVMCSGSGENMANLELRAREKNFRPVPLDVTATLTIEIVRENAPIVAERVAVDVRPRGDRGATRSRGILVAGPMRQATVTSIPPISTATADDPENTADLLAVQFATVDRLLASNQADRPVRIVFFDDAAVRRSGEVVPLPFQARDASAAVPRRAILIDRASPGSAALISFGTDFAARAEKALRSLSAADAGIVAASTGAAAVPLGVSGLIDAPILGIEAMAYFFRPDSFGDAARIDRVATLLAGIDAALDQPR